MEQQRRSGRSRSRRDRSVERARAMSRRSGPARRVWQSSTSKNKTDMLHKLHSTFGLHSSNLTPSCLEELHFTNPMGPIPFASLAQCASSGPPYIQHIYSSCRRLCQNPCCSSFFPLRVFLRRHVHRLLVSSETSCVDRPRLTAHHFFLYL